MPDIFLRDLGARIASLRKDKGLSREALGLKAGVSHVTIGSIEKGETATNLNVLRCIAAVLRVQPWQLLRPDEPLKSLVLAPIPGWDTLAEELRQLAQGDAAELVAQWLDTLRLFKAALERQKLRDDASQGEPDNG